MSLKKTVLSSLLITGLTLPLFAQANDLTITNNTDQDSTSKINQGLCSKDILGPNGITYKHSTRVIKNVQIKVACMAKPEDCKADVYMTNNCTGSVITTIDFSVTKGIKGHTPVVNGYRLTVENPFKVTLDGGPKT